MTLREAVKEATLVFVGVFLLFTMVAGGVALFKWIDHEQQRIALEFKETCEAKSGQAVWNGRYWECLR